MNVNESVIIINSTLTLLLSAVVEGSVMGSVCVQPIRLF